MPLIIGFANPENSIVTDPAVVHDNEAFRVRWSALNIGDEHAPDFVDFFVITSISEGCPASDNKQHDIVFESDIPEAELAAGAMGRPVEVKVGPFPAGSYQLTVELAADLDLAGIGRTASRYIDIKKAT